MNPHPPARVDLPAHRLVTQPESESLRVRDETELPVNASGEAPVHGLIVLADDPGAPASSTGRVVEGFRPPRGENP